ncbi:MAG: aminomethyl-transferring glycine dehydrogenase [Endozoicomonadaceae bacterium]|nr:aminomethyl-transferring glycine dehydrogenase [Endozoicomonadaceae bacterium]
MTVEYASLKALENKNEFIGRHIGPSEQDTVAMLAELGLGSLEELFDNTVPESILQAEAPAVGEAHTEAETLSYLKAILSQNQSYRSFIGMGYHDTLTPTVILRNVMENPGWYTAYTPYQSEISQGRLEALLNFQHLIMDLTGLNMASASLLDEATAAGEALALARRVSKNKKSNLFYIDESCHPQTIDVVKTRAKGFNLDLILGPAADAVKHDSFGALLAYSNTYGQITHLQSLIEALKKQKTVVSVVADIMSLVLMKSPGFLGADVTLGSAQRFGVPMGYGGPHAAFFAIRKKYKRSLPGRVIGVSIDQRGNKSYRLAMQTREQHIRREKATSNICTAQVLLANMASFYAVYHGPEGLKNIASRIHRLTDILAVGLKEQGVALQNTAWFDTITFQVKDKQAILSRANARKVNLRIFEDNRLSISLDECTTREDILCLWNIVLGDGHGLSVDALDSQIIRKGFTSIPAELIRNDTILTHPVFNRYHSETEMLRYIKRLEDRDLSLNHSMIPLGSCTMKLNATTEMLPVTWPELGRMHPFVPLSQSEGTRKMIRELEDYLKIITGFDAISMQPNSGAQGEYAGLMAIRNYLENRDESHRNICLIPSSAHGTNPASAVMAGMKVIVIACDENGNVNVADLKQKAEDMQNKLAAMMITYPSTHGVYEEDIQEICNIIHVNGGQVYMDGANMNGQIGISMPAEIGADIFHWNLHKTLCIPHGGGGPGMGPIGIKQHLIPFVANHSVVKLDGPNLENTAISAAPWGSVSILPVSWAYIRMMGSEGIRKSTAVAIMNANYLAKKLAEYYPVLYTGRNGRVAHECIIDIRPLKVTSGISEEDIAKRLIDFGFHAPTMSFPVVGTLMIEPTESESKVELDRFIEAMVQIRREIARVENNELDAENNMLVRAPHTLADIMDDEWDRPYTRKEAAYPVPSVARRKFWPSVNRVDNVYGDRHLMCSCPSVES